MNDHMEDIVASNVNEEAVVLFGSTTNELIWTSALASAIVVPVFILIGVIVGRFSMFMVLSLVAVFLVTFIFSKLMQVIKRGRPDGFFMHMVKKGQMRLGFQYMGMQPASFVAANGVMSTLRSKQIVVLDRHLPDIEALLTDE